MRFANVSHDGIVAEIQAALARLVETLGYDRCTYTEFAPDGTLHVVCSAAVGGIEPLPRGPFGVSPWLVGEIRAGRVVALADLPHGLPPEAAPYADRARRIGLRSHLSIPLRVGGRVVGALSFGGLRGARTWPGEVITRLTIIGEVFASAVARARFEEEAQQLRGRLWHADRVARTAALTAAIAHELNQPLAAILSNAQAGLRYLERGAIGPEEMRAILEAVVRDDKRAADTIRTMRALLRHDETGRARIDVAAALREVLQLLAAELRRQGVRVETELGANCWADGGQGADRAGRAQPGPQRRRGDASVPAGASGASACRLARTDDGRVVGRRARCGVGIAAEHLDAVFEPFWTTRREGLGLGLAVCRSIVQAHRGTIAVEPNRIAASPSASSCRPRRRSGGGGRSGARSRAAVAGTNRGRRAHRVRRRRRRGRPREPRPAARGRRVERAARTHRRPSSSSAPRSRRSDASCWTTGCRACPASSSWSGSWAAASRRRWSSSPGTATSATGVEAMKLGAVDFLVKPVEVTALIAAVRKALERHAGERKRSLEREAYRGLVRRLSVREREVLEHVLRGRLNKQIAADLDIAEQTVKQHRGRVMEKIGVRSVAELVRVCEAAGLPHRPGRSPARAAAD